MYLNKVFFSHFLLFNSPSTTPPLPTCEDISCSCLMRCAKSVTHWMTVAPRGTVYANHWFGMMPFTSSLT